MEFLKQKVCLFLSLSPIFPSCFSVVTSETAYFHPQLLVNLYWQLTRYPLHWLPMKLHILIYLWLCVLLLWVSCSKMRSFFSYVDVTLNACMLKCTEANSNSESNYHLPPLPELSSFGLLFSSNYLDFYKLLPFFSSFLGDNYSFISLLKNILDFQNVVCFFAKKCFTQIELFILNMEAWKFITI